MAFDARTSELRELARSQIVTPDDSDPERLERLKEQKLVLDALEKWAGARSARWSKLVEIVESLNGQAEKAFYEEALAVHAEMRVMFDCLRTSDVKAPSLAGLRIVTEGAIEEDRFQGALEGCQPVALAMDAIVRYNRELSEKIEALNAKWSESERIASAIVRDEQSVIDDIAAVMKNAVEIEAEGHLSAREKFRSWVTAAKDAAKLVVTGAAILGAVPPETVKIGKEVVEKTAEILVDPWQKMAGDVETRKRRYEEYFTHDHESLLVMFKGTRADAQDFVEKHDYTKLVLDWTSKARAAIEALHSAAATSGQKSDADALATRFSSALEKAESEAKLRWDAFVRENQAKFFGAISPDVEKALMGSDWDTRYQKIVSLDLQGLLHRWIGDMKRDYDEIDWSDVPESWQGELRERMRLSLEKLSETEEEIARNNSPDVLMIWLKGKSTELANKLR